MLEWGATESILYALAVGIGARPLDKQTLAFVYERDLRAVPTIAATMARQLYPSFEEMGVDYQRVVQLAQKSEFHAPVPAQGNVIGRSSLLDAHDLGPGRGAIITIGTTLHDQVSGCAMVSGTTEFLARGDGGFGGRSCAAPARHPIPSRVPDATTEVATSNNQALLYRLLGDRNPIHADPDAARAAGFNRPLLHGLCTFGVTCCTVLETFAQWNPARVISHELRFSGPVYPGDNLLVDLWKDANVISFVVRVPARGAKVIDNGRSLLAEVSLL